MSLLDALFGRRLASWEAEETKIGAWRGVPVLGLDALGSASYGPEAALTILIPLGAAGLRYIAPITAVILVLLAILYLSYRQTIGAYPNGGGAYVVAKENLGTRAGLLAAAALLLDYILNVAVGISAGVGALVSAMPVLHPYILPLCLGVLLLIAIINLRGVRESAGAFGVPTYLFVASLGGILVVGIARTIASGGHPRALVPPPHAAATATTAATFWLLLRAFASGCTAMTGVEAVSNGVTAFREPPVVHARRTLTAIVVTLGVFLAGIAWLAHVYGVTAMAQEKPGYQSVISLLVAAVVGRGTVYYVTLGSVLAVLCLSANTSFAGFPRLCRIVAEDDYLPHAFANIGRRLVYTGGIVVLTAMAALLLVVFGGITDRLIPLFAVGAFGAFVLSQAGMVVHWKRIDPRRHWLALSLNAVGAVVTAVALGVIITAKFKEGAWITIVLVPVMLLLFRGVKRHYRMVERQLASEHPADLHVSGQHPVVVVPIKAWDNLAAKALRFGMTISSHVIALHVYTDEEGAAELRKEWERHVERPMRAAGDTVPELVLIQSPYRRLFAPIVRYVDRLQREGDAMIAVILPDLVEGRWWENLLHTHRAGVLRSLLLMKGNQRVVVISVPWFLERRGRVRAAASSAQPGPEERARGGRYDERRRPAEEV